MNTLFGIEMDVHSRTYIQYYMDDAISDIVQSQSSSYDSAINNNKPSDKEWKIP